jgi:hypothetical protein
MGLGFMKVKKSTLKTSDKDKSPAVSISTIHPPSLSMLQSPTALSIGPTSTPSLSTATSNSPSSDIDAITPEQHTLKITRCCDGVFPLNEKAVRDNLDMLNKFCPHDRTDSKYVIKMVGSSDQPNFYSKTCTGEGVPWKNKTGAGVRCNGCQELWKKSGPKLKQTPLKKTGGKLRSVVNALHAITLTEADAEVLERFTHRKDADLNENGIQLREKARYNYQFYKEAKVTPSFLICTIMYLDCCSHFSSLPENLYLQ